MECRQNLFVLYCILYFCFKSLHFMNIVNSFRTFYNLKGHYHELYPGPRGFLLILSFFIWKFATRSADRSAKPRRKRKPLVKIVENLTFMLAQHLIAVKDFIFF